jgi:nitroreductase
MKECLNLLKLRRSIRKFELRNVPNELIVEALEAARFAPSAWNKQPWKFIIIKDKNRISKLAEILNWSAETVKGAALAIVVTVNKEVAGPNYQVDGAIVATYLWLSLTATGLGAAWIASLGVADKLRTFLNIPESYVPITTFAVGFPAEKPGEPERKGLTDLIYCEEFGKGC